MHGGGSKMLGPYGPLTLFGPYLAHVCLKLSNVPI